MGQLKHGRFITVGTIFILMTYLTMIAVANESFAIQKKAKKADEFGFVNREDLVARLDKFAVALHNDPGATGYIKVFSGRRLPPGEVQATADYAKDYLVTSRDIEPGRITTIDAGTDRNSTIQFWIVPQGATPPM